MARTLIVVGDALQAGGSVLTGSPQTDIDGHPVALPPARDAGADGGDGAGELVAQREGQLLMGQGMRLRGDEDGAGVVLVEVSAADTVEADLQLHLAWAWRRDGDVLDRDFVGTVVDSCSHATSCM